ncbi:MAG: COG1470 family protein [Methanotrichaceae archaeon]
MKLINLLVVLLFLVGVATADLAADKDLFEIELHPGEYTERTFKLENMGDAPIFEIRSTPVAGDAKNLVTVTVPEFDKLNPESEDKDNKDEVDVNVHFFVPSDRKPGTYTGVAYFWDGVFPSLPIPVNFEVEVIKQESYGISLNIEDARSASMRVDAKKLVKFELEVRNTGLFTDVVSINITPVPESWTVILFDHDKSVDLPYNLSLSPTGAVHKLDLIVVGENPGESQEIKVTATSRSDPSKNATVIAEVDLKPAIRRYNVVVDIPKQILVNKTYTGTIAIELGVDEDIAATVITPQSIMVIPEIQVVPVKEEETGIGEFVLVATQPGDFTFGFKLIDSNGVPLPEVEKIEIVATNATDIAENTVNIVNTTNFAIVTGDDLFHKTLAWSCAETKGNENVSVIVVPDGKLSKENLEKLMETPLSRVVILGNSSIVSSDAEEVLAESVPVERIAGDDICETSWLFASAMWPQGVEEVVLVGTGEVEVFGAYQEAKARHVPPVICGSGLSDGSISAIEDLMSRDTSLSRVLVWGNGVNRSAIQAMKDMNLSVEVL